MGNRLYNLDYLRGLAAFGIMAFHYLKWTKFEFLSDSFMGRVGVYGVSIFYILSGLTLYYVYYNRMKPSREDVKDFTIKRVLRIFPLLWFATFLSVVVNQTLPGIRELFLNLTGLFGFFDWNGYFAEGAWSIGNELVFYALFPFMILFSKRSKPLLATLGLLLLAIYIYFAFFILDENGTIVDQWENYVNPLNQAFLFLSGFLMGLFFQKINVAGWLNLTLLAGGLLLFIFYPVYGDRINLVTGTNRLVFTLLCIIICFGFFKLQVHLPPFLEKPLTLLGEASYSVYLLHPLVYAFTGSVFSFIAIHYFRLPETLRVLSSVIGTLVFSYLTYVYFEKYFMRLGKQKTKQATVPS